MSPGTDTVLLHLRITGVLMALLVVAILGFEIINIVLVMGAVGWIWHARIVRGNVLRIREEQYVLAAEMVGRPRWRSMRVMRSAWW